MERVRFASAADQASSHTGLAQAIWLFSWVTHR